MTLAELIAEARRLDEAATKGPWRSGKCSDLIEEYWGSGIDANEDIVLVDDEDADFVATCGTVNNPETAAFIAFARTALPRLARVARAAVEMRRELQDYADNDDHVYEDCEVTGPAEDCPLCGTLRAIAAFDAAARGEEP